MNYTKYVDNTIMSILQVGSVVNNYKIIKVLGQGQLGATYLGQRQTFDPMTGQPITKAYAIKTLNLTKVAEMGLDPSTIEAEAKVLKQMSSNPVCDIYITCYYDYFLHTIAGTDDRPSQYLIVVTDYITGESLQQILLDQVGKGNFDMNKLLQMMFEIAQAVDYIHTHGVVHQNIKPSNIVYDKVLNRLRLIDFSFSCSQNLNTKCKGKAGTAYYMPPDLLRLPVDPSQQEFALRAAHDIWSLGVIFFQMANPGQDFMQFTSNDPSLIAKDIQIGNVKDSQYPYIPINSFIKAILKKDPTRRPTAGQVVILIRLARPLCVVNEQLFDRQMSEALVTSLGVDVDPQTDDYTLCKALTDYLSICKIKDNDYQKKSLLKLAKILGIKVERNVESAVLCNTIQQGLKTHQDDYSDYVTQAIIQALEYMSWIQVRVGSEVTGNLHDILKQLQERYKYVYGEAKNLELINLKMLESRRQDVTLKSLVYKQNASVSVANVYATLAQSIVAVILDNNPDAEVGGVPLQTFQKQIL
uniref:non-specific serine/threonine protein kinase n=1 Tax=Marseillevirus LCMAC202 TaxID=2506606 RepID=A0A481YYP4_9VIRU|nr:MAG: putative serine/threonine protein kinase [Marseillevirus LCMAC202]